MTFTTLTRFTATLLAATLVAGAAVAADTDVRIRGSVVSLAGDQLTVKSREGANVVIKLNAGYHVSGVAKAALADIKPGDFVGIASLPTAAGGDGALEVLIFPPAMKGTGEGSYGWDLKPDSSMTNGSVADAVKSVEGSTVTVTYHGQSKKIVVPAGTPVVTLADATAVDIKPGAPVFIPAKKADGGALGAGFVIVGKNGVVPPM